MHWLTNAYAFKIRTIFCLPLQDILLQIGLQWKAMMIYDKIVSYKIFALSVCLLAYSWDQSFVCDRVHTAKSAALNLQNIY